MEDDNAPDQGREDRFCLRCLVCGGIAALVTGRHQLCDEHAATLQGAARAGYAHYVPLDDCYLGLCRGSSR